MSEPETVLSLWKGPVARAHGSQWLSLSLTPSLVAQECQWAADTHHIPSRLIMGLDRTGPVALARHALMWKLRQYKREGVSIYSYPSIGRALGRDHTSVMHGEKRYERWLSEQEA